MMVMKREVTKRRRSTIQGLLKLGTGLTLAAILVLVPGCPILFPPATCTTNADCTNENSPVCVIPAGETDGTCEECGSNADCDDGLFCNGTETCDANNTCSTGSDPCTGDQVCDEANNECDDVCTADTDCNDGDACTNDACADEVCENTAVNCGAQVCDPSDGSCVDCLNDSDCGVGETCGDDNTCQPAPPVGFNVNISGCPAGTSNGVDIALTAAATGAAAGNQVTFVWSAPGGGFDTTSGASVVFNTNSSTTVTVTAQENEVTVNDGGTPDDPSDDTETLTPVGAPVTDTCAITVIVETELTVSAGADRAFAAGGQAAGTPPLTDFPGAYPGAGATLRSEFGSGAPTPPAGVGHAVGRIYKNLQATASDPAFANTEITFTWECVSAPDPATCSNVTLLDPTSVGTGFLVASVPTAQLTGLQVTGLTNTLQNLVVPGQYTFRVTAANPNGDTSSDDVTWTVTPGFAIPAAGAGSLEGMALANGQLTNRVIRPNSIVVPFTVLARSAGTIRFLLTDTSGAADAQTPASLNEVSVTPSNPAATSMAEAMVSGTTRGSYTVNGQFEAGEATVPSVPTGLTVRIQNAVSGSIDTNASTAGSTRNHFGAVNSTSLASGPIIAHHGARAADAGNEFWDGQVTADCDLNGDGFPEVLNGRGNVLSIMTGITVDPSITTNSPFTNVLNNGGLLTENAAGGAGTIDSFALTDANLTGTVPDVTQISSICCGDFDGDGNLDLAIGEGGFDAGADGGEEGRILVFYNQGNNAFGQNPYTTNGNTVASGALTAQPRVITRTDGLAVAGTIIDRNDRLGESMVCCDVNNDGFSDIIAGAPGGGQAITLTTGVLVNDAADAADTTLTVDTVDATTVFEPGDIAVVDANNDGQSMVRRVTAVTATLLTFDLAQAAGNADNETVDELVGATGAVFGILGNSIRLPNSTTITDAGTGSSFRIIPNSSVSGDLIGASLACCDFNADGISDIAFGAPGRKDSATATRVAAGSTFLTFGRTSGLSGNINTIDRIYEGNVAGLGFGRRLACCNWDGSGGDDLIVGAGVGATLGAVGTGRLYFISSTTTNIQSAAAGTSTLTTVPQMSGSQTDSDLGACIACWEFSGDNLWDVLATAPSATAANQLATLINGNAAFGATVSATATFSDSDTTHTLFDTPTEMVLWSDFDDDIDVGGALFNSNGCGFVDTNGDKIKDLFFQGDDDDAQNVSNAFAIMGAE